MGLGRAPLPQNVPFFDGQLWANQRPYIVEDRHSAM